MREDVYLENRTGNQKESRSRQGVDNRGHSRERVHQKDLERQRTYQELIGGFEAKDISFLSKQPPVSSGDRNHATLRQAIPNDNQEIVEVNEHTIVDDIENNPLCAKKSQHSPHLEAQITQV